MRLWFRSMPHRKEVTFPDGYQWGESIDGGRVVAGGENVPLLLFNWDSETAVILHEQNKIEIDVECFE